jgi:hypothetical protein
MKKEMPSEDIEIGKMNKVLEYGGFFEVIND